MSSSQPSAISPTPNTSPNATFTLFNGKLTLLNQPPRPSEDPLWLAASLPPLPTNTTVLDIGCGSGILGLSCALFYPTISLSMLDSSPKATQLASKNAILNHLEPHTLTQNILTFQTDKTWDVIVSNPPFHQTSMGHTSKFPEKIQAHSAPSGLLEQWFSRAMSLTTSSAHFILHTSSLPLFCTNYACYYRYLQTSPHRPAKRVILHIYKNQPTTWQQLPNIAAYCPTLRTHVLQHAQTL